MLGDTVGQVTSEFFIIAKYGVDLFPELPLAVLQHSQRLLMGGREHMEVGFDQHVHLVVVMPERFVEALGVFLLVVSDLVDLVFQCVVSRLERGLRPLLGE